MRRDLASILQASIELAEIQLEAARSLDAEGLREATARRQDLVFELERYTDDDLKRSATDGTREMAVDLAELDHRLGRILGAALGTFDRLLPEQKASTYAADGRIRGPAR
ncbi:MAG: hypothetical protein VX265_03440 [Myxococcota bacterium]|nr:hypothetical protein [Myxococcota bacterium]